MKFLKKAVNTIEKHSMLLQGDFVLIGLSGGPDSICLTFILDKLRNNFNLTLRAVYVDHGLRPEEVGREVAFCKALCDRLGIGFYSKSVDVRRYAKARKLGIQEAARELRYQVFEEISMEINATKIALGHNADDQAETVLMRLLRGSGRRGLSGIPPVRGKIVRPLIEVERKEIEEFLASSAALIPEFQYLLSKPFIIDSSNLKTDYLRNWLRLKVMPEFKGLNPALVYSIGRTAEILRDEDAYLDTITTKILTRLISKESDRTIELFLSPLEKMERPIFRRILRGAINKMGDIRGMDFIHIEDIIELIKKGKSGDMLNLPKGIRAIKRYSTLLLTSEISIRLKTRALNVPGRLFIEESGISIEAEISESFEETFDGRRIAVFDCDSLGFPLYMRMRQDGDYFYPSGFCKRKKLQDFFVDEKVPRDKRDIVPVVVSGEDIIWVVGYRMDERFKAKKGTKQFLIMRIS